MVATIPPYNLLIDQARRNAHNQVLFDIDNGPLLKSFLMDDFAYSLGNHFEILFENLMEVGNSAQQMGKRIGSSLVGIGGKQAKLQNVNQTISQWTASDRISFSLNLCFVATTPDADTRAPILALNSLLLPGFTAGLSQLMMNAPNGYQANATSCNGGIGLAIGKWFHTPRWFLLRSCTPSFSRVVTTKGFPIMALAQCQLESYRVLSAQEFNSFFVGTAPLYQGQNYVNNPDGFSPTDSADSIFFNPRN